MKIKITKPLLLAAYLALTLTFTYPLALNFSTHIPGSGGDNFVFLWNLWWIKKALIEIRTNPLYCDYIFYPLGHSLVFHALTLFNGLLSIPLQLLFNIVIANNIIIIFSFVFSAYGAYLLAEYLTKNKIGAFIAGLIFAFCPYIFAHLKGHFNLTSTEWMPFYILYLIKSNEEKPRAMNPLLAGLFLALTALCDYYYLIYLIIFKLIYFFHLVIIKKVNYSVIVKNLILIILIFSALFSPVLVATISELDKGPHYYQMWGQNLFVADLRGYISPSPWHPFLGIFGKYRDTLNLYSWSHGKFLQHSGVEGVVFAGYAVLLLSIYCMIRFRKEKGIQLWTIAFLTFMLLSLGPYLHINGKEFRIPLPYLLLQYIPVINGVRAASRFNIMVMLSAAILAAYSIKGILFRLQSQRRGVVVVLLIGGLISFEYLNLPIELYHYNKPKIFEQIAKQSGDFQIWEITSLEADASLDQIGHEKRIFNTLLSRRHPDNLKYYSNLPFVKRLSSIKEDGMINVTADTIARDRIIFKESMPALNIHYIIVHLPYAFYIIDYLEKVLDLEKICQNSKLIVYKVVQRDKRDTVNISISFGDSLSNIYLGRGWLDSAKWNGETYYRPMGYQKSEIFFHLGNPLPKSEMTMTMKIKPITSEWGSLELYIKDQYLSSWKINKGWHQYLLKIPPGFFHEGLNLIKLQYSALYTKPSPNANFIGDIGLRSPVNIIVNSAGFLCGYFGHILINGKNVSPQKRGYNLAMINPKTGSVETVDGFDTYLDAKESERLAKFIEKIPKGKIVAVAVKDEASRKLTLKAVDALKTIGTGYDLRNKYWWGHAIIGVKGAAAGTALESAGKELSQMVSVGNPPDLALVFDYIELKGQ